MENGFDGSSIRGWRTAGELLWSPRWEMMLAGRTKGHAIERRAQIFCSTCLQSLLSHPSPLWSWLQSPPCRYFISFSRRAEGTIWILPASDSHLAILSYLGESQNKRSLLGKRRRALGKRGWGWEAGSWRGDPSPDSVVGAHLPLCSNCPSSLRTRGGKVSL